MIPSIKISALVAASYLQLNFWPNVCKTSQLPSHKILSLRLRDISLPGNGWQPHGMQE